MSRLTFIAMLAAFLALPALHAQPNDHDHDKPPAPKTGDSGADKTPKKTPIEAWEDGVGKVDTPVGSFTIGGYASIHHRTLSKYNGGDSKNYFDAHKIVPQFSWRIWSWLEFAMEIEFEGGGAGASFLSQNYILVEYGEGRITPMEELNFKFGLMLIPFGRYNLNHDDVFWDLVDRPWVARFITATAFDQPGAGIYGSFDQIPFLGINYDIQVTQGFDHEFDGNQGSRNARQSFRDDNNDNKAIWMRLGLVPNIPTNFFSADLGFSFNYQDVGKGNTQATRGVAVDGVLKFRIMERFNIDVNGEWARIWINRPSSPASPNGLWAWHADVLFKFDPFPASWRGDIFGRNPYIGLILRIEQTDLNDDHVGSAANDDRIGVTVGLSFRPISKIVFRTEFKHHQSKKRDDGDETILIFSISMGF